MSISECVFSFCMYHNVLISNTDILKKLDPRLKMTGEQIEINYLFLITLELDGTC